MIYQSLHLGDPPYIISLLRGIKCYAHKHTELELIYCFKDKLDIIINKNNYTLKSGELVIIGSKISHEIPDTNKNPDVCGLILEIGPAMLGNYFDLMANDVFSLIFLDLKKNEYAELYSLFEEAKAHKENPSRLSNLIIKTNVYRIALYILDKLIDINNLPGSKKLDSFMPVDTALEYIYENYSRKIILEEVADLCGYSKSNFCKVFKDITGETFHSILNRHRVKQACILLKESKLSIDEVASLTGFIDSKNFCRNFKPVTGVTPSEYRKATKKE